MRRCNRCGHTNGRLRPAKNFYTGQPIPGQHTCLSPRACIRRMELEGQWVGKRVLRRIDRDGTEWTIRPQTDHVLMLCVYRQHHLTSRHPTIDAAKEHADDLLASFFRPKADDYRVIEPSDEPGLFA